jgi:transposase
MLDKSKPPDWFDPQISLLLNLPVQTQNSSNFYKDGININFGQKKHNDKFNEHFKFLDQTSIFDFYEIKIDNNDLIKKLNNDKEKKINLTSNPSTIAGIKTKFDNKIKNLSKTTISYNTLIYPNKKQKDLIKKMGKDAIELYNLCVDIYNREPKYFDTSYMTTKLEIFKLMPNCILPYDSKTHVISKFYDNLKSAKTNLDNDNIKFFIMKKKKFDSSFNIYIPKTSVSKETVYTTHFGKIKGISSFFNEYNIDLKNIGDCYIRYDYSSNRFFFIVPYHKNKSSIEDKKDVVAIDPGEAIAFTYFSHEGFGFLGKDIRKKILEEQQKIKKMQSLLKKKINKDGQELKNIALIKNKLKKYYGNIQNYVKELHNKVALYLVKNYKTIMIPEFKTQRMIRNNDYINYKLDKNLSENEKNELVEKIKGKSIGEINEILNIYSKEKPEKENKEKEIKEDLLKKELKNLEKMYKKFTLNLESLNKDYENIYKKSNYLKIQKIKELYDKELKKKNLLIKENLLKLGLNEKETETYIGNCMETLNKNEKKEKAKKNVEKLKETLKRECESEKEKQENIKKSKEERNNKLRKVFELIEKVYGEKITKIYKKEITRRSRLNKRVKFVLQMLSHYKFRKHLENKSNEYGCKMIIVSEEYTSKTCTNCGNIGNKYRNRIRVCEKCNYELNRDITGSRNIYIKNIEEVKRGVKYNFYNFE